MGDGTLSGQIIDDMTDVISQKSILDINGFKILSDGKVKIQATFNNQGLSTGFYWKELAIFATDPDNPAAEIMYCYGNAGALSDYIPAQGSQILEKVISVLTIISNAANVTATIDSSNVFLTSQDADDIYVKKSLATTASQFLVSSGVGQFVAKTVSEIKALLGLGTAADKDFNISGGVASYDIVNAHLFDMAQNADKVIQPNDGKYNSWPVIVRAQNGDILVFYSKGSQHVSGDPTRAVVYKRSTDSGMTWSDEATLLNDTYDDAIFSVGVSSSGTIIVIIRRVISSTENYDQVVMTSIDNGFTWSAPSTISVLPVSTISVSPIIEVEGHGLMASFNDRPYSCELIWSTDEGKTWGNRQTITIPTDSNDAPLECRFVYIGNGKIFGIGRTNVVGDGLFQLQSEDYGANWTVLKTNITDHYMTPTALIYQNSEVDIVYYHRATGALRQRHASITDIWGKSLFWTDSKVISYGSLKAADAGYPHSINLINDTCLCVYYSGSGNDSGTGGSAGIYGVLYSFKNNLCFKTPSATTSDLTYYIDRTNGLDTNDGLTLGMAFKTITKAISMIPQIINHTVTINVVSGDYSDEGNIPIQGYVGKSGEINFSGDIIVPNNVSISRLAVGRCAVPIIIRGFNLTTAGSASIAVSTCLNVEINNCNLATFLPSVDGISFINSNGIISNCVLSNKANAIRCTNSQIYSDTNSGSGNTVGLLVEKCGTIGKNGGQPSGTTLESVTTGGIIR
jgi:hypothetical protein